MNTATNSFDNLGAIATHLRERLETKKYILLFAFNGTGKTRLSMAFKELGKQVESEEETRDSLYFNAFTEDLFYWDNDLENDAKRVLRLNRDSHFFDGLQELEMENRIGPLLARYADFDFLIDYETWEITFFRNKDADGAPIPIKVSRGEENIFVWCFFLAVAELAVDQEEGSPYAWVKYLYIDDPISSLDDNNAIAVASHLAQLLKNTNGQIKAVISTHHALFFNVLWNELNERGKSNPLLPLFLSYKSDNGTYSIRYTNETPFFHHVALLEQLHKVAESGEIYTYHFNILRNILEKTATFHGFRNFSACIKQDSDDPDGILHARLVNVLSHGNYSLYEPQEMLPENKEYFRKILRDFMNNYRFNPELFPEPTQESANA
ncbi:AAA family ATPase [Halomonas daqingensis]|uniref:AAA family ATPase n=1 Tax=Billgrantia desiderata TaxID=52021 RepID=A0ABS9B485_9GAMM|nr:AAA family ATPase [Halomonas desiderata]MCE8013417.1 AAA family ATPase [Halomonas desiderata]MCE8028928.1 AAA family ATPase [Halomonas desiderata]MCE8042137.1 AAA family ATPase [Halomonas desiderata]MCE8046718.1 AAA family ATPase [Halomonas desiderata]